MASFCSVRSVLLFVVRPGAPSSVLAPSRNALVPSSFLFLYWNACLSEVRNSSEDLGNQNNLADKRRHTERSRQAVIPRE